MNRPDTDSVSVAGPVRPKMPRGLAIRLAVALLAFGSLVTALISGVELYRGYRSDIRELERRVTLISVDQRAMIEGAVWVIDDAQIQSLLEGMSHIPYVEFIGIKTDEKTRWSIGEVRSTRRLIRQVDLERDVNGKKFKIGELTVVMSEDDVIRHRLEQFSSILFGNALTIGLLASFVLFVFHYLVTRHLGRLSRFLATLDPSQPRAEPLQLARQPGKLWRPDELDLVVAAINQMVTNLRASEAERAAAIARLSEREAFLGAVVSHAGAAIDVIDRDSLQLLEVNDSACTLLGYSRDELLQRRLSDLQADFAEEHLHELLAVMADGEGGSFVTRYRRKDGQVINIDLTMRLIKLDGRRLLVSVWSDITRQKLLEQELAAARDDLRSITENVSAALWTVDATGHFLYANPAACVLSGYTQDQMRQMTISQLVEESERVRLPAEIRALLSGHQATVSEWTLLRQDGGAVPVELTSQQLPDGRFLAIGRDITERRKSDEELRRAAGVFANSLEGIMITNGAGVIVDVNPAFSQITGFSHAEAVGQRPSILSSGRHSPDFYDDMWRALAEHDRWRGEVWNRKKSGEVFVEMLSISAVRDAAGNIKEYVAVSSDISRIKQHEDELDRIAHYDPLTGLPNRRLLDDRLRLAKSRAERESRLLAVCFIDLDGFKPINDEFGHATGDHVLVTIAQRLEKTMRGGDTVARMGGDEFVLLLGDLENTEECTPALDRVLQLIAEPVRMHERSVSVSASIGVTLYPVDSADTDTLLRHADQAMYVAKELGKNRVHLFDAENDRRVAAHREALAELHNALANNEFVLYYQPKVDLRNGEVIGAEALIRWRKPDGQIIPPGEFLPTLDGSALEVKVSMWVIETTMAQIARWKAVNLPARISANLVASHLQQLDFLEWLELLLACYPTLEAGDLNLEILESAAIGDIDVVAERLAAVRALGVGVALDDFGTGYSSLAYFRRLPIDTLKIDQGFVRDMLDDKEALGIVHSVVRLAAVFNRRVIAEGVETLEHWRTLLDMDCDFGQGYGIARPMPADQFPAWVAQWRESGPWREFVREEK